MQQIRNIIFDLGGVLLDIDIPKTKQAFTDLGVKDIEKFFGIGHAAACFKDHEMGKISNEEFLASLSDLAGGSIPPEKLMNAWNAMLIKFPNERIELLTRLKNKYRLFLFSNTNGIHHKTFNRMYSDAFKNGKLDDLFEKSYYSHLIGIRKPEKEAFEYIIRDKQLKVSETLFIDDALPNIRGAEEAGLQTIYLPPGKTILDIEWEKLQ